LELHELKYNKGARRPRKRKARGAASGWGKTAGRGQKGQNSRSGGGVRIGFEGGQMALKRRLPKVGFTARNPRVFSVVNLDCLSEFPAGTEVNPELLLEKRIIRKLAPDGVKILARGKIDRKLIVWAHSFSRKAREAIEAAGGSCQQIK